MRSARPSISYQHTCQTGCYGVESWVRLTFWEPLEELLWQKFCEKSMTPGNRDTPIALSWRAFLFDNDVVNSVLPLVSVSPDIEPLLETHLLKSLG